MGRGVCVDKVHTWRYVVGDAVSNAKWRSRCLLS